MAALQIYFIARDLVAWNDVLIYLQKALGFVSG
jgi:hypothetical protein